MPLPQHVPPVPAQGPAGRQQPWSWRCWKLHFVCCWAASRGELLISEVLNHQSQAVQGSVEDLTQPRCSGKRFPRGPWDPIRPLSRAMPSPALDACWIQTAPRSSPCPPTQPSVLLFIVPVMMEREVYSPAIKHCLILTLQHHFIDPWIQTKAHKLL